MSDTFGATELDNDMPGIGPEPGNVRGAPVGLSSQLQGLVQRFTQQSTGKPNPKFLPPPPNAPKQSQMGSTDAPDPTARSFAPVPANAPQPPAKFNPYMQPIPRDSSQWGQPEQFPRLPQSFELPGMYQTLGGYFGQHGGFAGAPMGAGMTAYSKAYMDAFQKGQEYKMRMAKEQMQLHAAQLAELEDARAVEYADVFSRHHEMGDDPSAVHDDLWKVAVEHGDKDVIAMIEGGASAEKVRRFLADHEAHIRALKAANTKSDELSDVDALYGLKKPGGRGGDIYDPYGPGATSSAPSAPSSPTAAAPTGEVAGPGAPDTRAPDAEQTPEIFKGVNPELAAAATKMYQGEEPTGMDKNALPYARYHAQRMQEETGKILTDPNLKPGQYLDAVRKRLGPTVASDMEGMEKYVTPPGSVSGYGKQGDYLRGLEGLIRKDMPSDPQNGVRGWVADYYSQRHLFTSSPTNNTILLRTKDMANQMDNLNNDLMVVQKELGKRGVKATDINLNGALQLLEGQESMSRLMSDLNAYSTAYNVVVSGGHATLGGQQAVDAYFKSYEPLSTIRNVIKGHVPSTQGILQGMHNNWESIGGRPDDMPKGDLSVERRIDDNGKMDTVTGARPYREIVNHNGVPALWTGKNQFDRNAKENWVAPGSTRD